MFKSQHLSLALAAALCIVPAIHAPLQAAVNPNLQTVADFSSAAEDAIPAVVSIKVKGISKQTSLNDIWGQGDEESEEMYRNDFFKRFFGEPKGKAPKQTEGQASGFIVSADGLLLTNSHVVKDADEIIVLLNDGKEFPAKVIGQDPSTDIAVIKIDAQNLPHLTLGNSDELKAGQWAIAVGNPLGLQATLTVGVISATGRNNLDLTRIEDFIQTDAAINRGNSGGPLLNLKGQVIGMNTAIVTDGGSGYMGIGFAIPSNMLKHVMDELVTTGHLTRGFLGIVMQQMDVNLAKAFNLEKSEGALVAEVSKDSPADKAGIKQGDIITKYNQHSVHNIATLRNAVALMKPGTNINLSILRDGKSMDIPINIGSFPTEIPQKVPVDLEENKFGFSVQNITPETAKSLGLTDEKGVVIAKIKPGSPAAWAGLKKGTLIVALNQVKVSSTEEFNEILASMKQGSPLLLLVKQDGAVRFVTLQIK